MRDVPARLVPARIAGGIDPGLSSGALVVIDRARRDRVLEAVSLVEASGAAKRAGEEARTQVDEMGG